MRGAARGGAASPSAGLPSPPLPRRPQECLGENDRIWTKCQKGALAGRSARCGAAGSTLRLGEGEGRACAAPCPCPMRSQHPSCVPPAGQPRHPLLRCHPLHINRGPGLEGVPRQAAAVQVGAPKLAAAAAAPAAAAQQQNRAYWRLASAGATCRVPTLRRCALPTGRLHVPDHLALPPSCRPACLPLPDPPVGRSAVAPAPPESQPPPTASATSSPPTDTAALQTHPESGGSLPKVR